jgi:Helix-turn-helix domain
MAHTRVGTDKPDDEDGFVGATPHEFGRYLQRLRESRGVTQTSLSTKTGAMAGHKISRSRISEIENAKRDRVSERELRVYMMGLKCTPQHINRMVTVLRQSTMTAPRESSADPVPTNSATPDPHSGGLTGAESGLTPRTERPGDDQDTPIPSLEASRSRVYHRREPGERVTLAVATALAVVALTGLGAELLRRGDSADLPPSWGGSPVVLALPPDNSPILGDTSDLVKNVTFPDPVQTSNIHDRPGLGKTASRDTTKRRAGHCCAHQAHDQAPGIAAVPDVEPHWYHYARGASSGWHPEQAPPCWQLNGSDTGFGTDPNQWSRPLR